MGGQHLKHTFPCKSLVILDVNCGKSRHFGTCAWPRTNASGIREWPLREAATQSEAFAFSASPISVTQENLLFPSHDAKRRAPAGAALTAGARPQTGPASQGTWPSAGGQNEGSPTLEVIALALGRGWGHGPPREQSSKLWKPLRNVVACCAKVEGNADWEAMAWITGQHWQAQEFVNLDNCYGTGAAPGRDPTPKGGGGGSTDPKIVVQNNVLCRRRRRRRFCFRHRAGGNFCVRPYVSVLKILRISWRIQKWPKSTKKDFDPDPASGSGLG